MRNGGLFPGLIQIIAGEKKAARQCGFFQVMNSALWGLLVLQAPFNHAHLVTLTKARLGLIRKGAGRTIVHAYLHIVAAARFDVPLNLMAGVSAACRADDRCRSLAAALADLTAEHRARNTADHCAQSRAITRDSLRGD